MRIVDRKDTGLNLEMIEHYEVFGQLPDGRICTIERFLYTWGLLINIDEVGYSERYCFHNAADAIIALALWNGEGEPENWHRYLGKGEDRRQEVPERVAERAPEHVRLDDTLAP